MRKIQNLVTRRFRSISTSLWSIKISSLLKSRSRLPSLFRFLSEIKMCIVYRKLHWMFHLGVISVHSSMGSAGLHRMNQSLSLEAPQRSFSFSRFSFIPKLPTLNFAFTESEFARTLDAPPLCRIRYSILTLPFLSPLFSRTTHRWKFDRMSQLRCISIQHFETCLLLQQNGRLPQSLALQLPF
jgi:hypothetical protein